MRPLVPLVLAEFVVLAALGALWLGADPVQPREPAPPSPAASPDATAPPVAAAMPLAAANEAAPATERRIAAAAVPAIAAGDPLGILLSGTVRDGDGKPVVGASVYISRDGGGRSGNSAAPGCYAIAGLQPGEWKVTCRADGHAQHEATCVLDDRAFQQHDIELQQSIVVRVKVQGADGKSIFDELQRKTMWGMPYVVATEAPLTGDLPPTTQSRLIRFGLGEWSSYDGSGGRAQPKLIAQGYCGELRLNRAPPAFASLLLRTTLLQGQRLEPGQKELVFTIEAADVLARHGTVKLRLLDAPSGQPIAGAFVSIGTAQGGGTQAKTDADGRAVIVNVVPGIGMLDMHGGAEREGLYRYVRVPSGGAVDLGDIRLSAAAKIVGVVVDASGKPANGASVQWTEIDARTFPQPLVGNRSSSADADGRFQLFGCGRHRYVVFARLRDGSSGFAPVDATSGAPAEVRITLGKSTKVALKANFGMTVGYVVTALAGDRSPVAVATLGTEYRPDSMALLPGDYTIEIHDMQTDRLARSFALQVGSEPLTIDVP